MIAISPRTEHTYVLHAERKLPLEQQTVWRYRPMTVGQQHAMGDDCDRDSHGNKIRNSEGTKRLTLVRTNLVGWENFADGKGGQVEHRRDKYGLVDMDVLEQIPFTARVEIAIAIENDVQFSTVELGKSEPQPT